MGLKHIFRASAQWPLKHAVGEIDNIRDSKSHTITIEGKPTINVSAAKAFKGNPDLYNPEDLLLSSLTSCHMMSYFYVCAKHGIKIVSYSDSAEGTLEVSPDGSGRFTDVILNPVVVVAQPEMISQALELHKQANELCFIANSCNFPIRHNPVCHAF